MRIKLPTRGSILALAIMFALVAHGCGPRSASLVIGQADFLSNAPNRNKDVPGAATLQFPGGPVALYNNFLYIADSGNNRVLAFSPIPASNGPAAAVVIESRDPQTWTNFFDPYGLSIADNKLFVADTQNNRVLIWNTVPTKNEMPDIVLGQADLTSESIGDCSHMRSPRALWATNDKLVVSDTSNNRVFIWNSMPAKTNPNAPIAADLILGNPDCTADDTGATRHAFHGPRGVWTDGTRLVIADYENNRVLIWSRFPARPTEDADIILGTGKAGAGPNQFNGPYAVTSDGVKLFISDEQNHRVLVWDKFPLKSDDLPTAVLGQKDFEHHLANGALPDKKAGSGSKANSLNEPQGLYYTNNQLWVSDTGNHRVLMFKW